MNPYALSSPLHPTVSMTTTSSSSPNQDATSDMREASTSRAGGPTTTPTIVHPSGQEVRRQEEGANGLSTSSTPPSPLSEPPSARPRSKAMAETRRVILNFTPSWFSVNMGTGIVSILLHELPYQFRGLGIISNVIFGFNVLLFLLFLLISAARYIIWPQMFPTMLFHPTQSLFLGTFSMGFTTIVNMCALSAAPAWGSGFATFTWVLWWINSVIAVFVCIGLPFLQFTRHQHAIDKITGVWFLPVVSTVVTGASGGIVAAILPPHHARLTLIVSWIQLGTGLGLAILLMALYYLRLAVYKIPPAALVVSAFLPLGPCGQGSFGLLKLSATLWSLSKSTGQALGTPASATADDARTMATAIYGVSIVAALLLWGLGLVWLVLAVSLFIDMASVTSLEFSLSWWGLTFPLGVFASAAIQFAKELDSGAWRVIATILSLCVVLFWLMVASLTTLGALKGNIFHSPCLAEAGGRPPAKSLEDRRLYKYEPKETSRSRSRSRVRGRS